MITRVSELIDVVLQAEPAKVAVAAAQDDAQALKLWQLSEAMVAGF